MRILRLMRHITASAQLGSSIWLRRWSDGPRVDLSCERPTPVLTMSMLKRIPPLAHTPPLRPAMPGSTRIPPAQSGSAITPTLESLHGANEMARSQATRFASSLTRSVALGASPSALVANVWNCPTSRRQRSDLLMSQSDPKRTCRSASVRLASPPNATVTEF